MSRFLKNKFILIGGVIILCMVLLSVFAPLLTSYDYGLVDLPNKHKAPCKEYLMGTDCYGRDVFTRIAYGGRISLKVAILSVAVAMLGGCILGVSAGYVGGWFDFVTGRLIDIMMAFPPLLLSLIIGVVVKPTANNMCLSIGIPLIPMFYRVARGNTLIVRDRTFVKAARSMGTRLTPMLLRHILPNVLPQIFVVLSSGMGGAILAEASLGFLGLGIPQPTPSWGLVVNEGKQYMFTQPWTTAFAGLVIALTILGFNLLGDGLRDCLDPKLQGRK